MTAQQPPFALENLATHTAQLLRQAASMHLTAGIVGVTDYAVTATGTPSMFVNVGAGSAWVSGSESAPQQAKYFCFNDATVNLAIAESDPTHGRIDVACITVQDSEYTGDDDDWVIQIITGTPSSSPVAPTLPANSLALNPITVAAGVTSITAGAIGPNNPAYSVGIRSNLVGAYTGSALAGANPPVGQPLSLIVGTYSGTTDSFSNLSIPFPAAFPNGLVYVDPKFENVTAGFLQLVTVPSNTYSLSGFTVTAWQDGSGLPSASIEVSYLALGW